MLLKVGNKYHILFADFPEIDNVRFADLCDYSETLTKEEKTVLRGDDADIDPLRWFEILAKYIELLSDISEDELRHTIFADLYAVYDIIKPVVLSSLGEIYFNVTGEKKWTVDGWDMQFVDSDIDITGEEMPLAGMTAKEFCECSDIQGFRYAGVLVSIILRPINEAYDEKIIKERGRKKYPMNVVFECMAELERAHKYIKGLYPNIYKKGKGKSSKFGWSGLLLWIGHENDNVYDFMQRLSYELERNEQV